MKSFIGKKIFQIIKTIKCSKIAMLLFVFSIVWFYYYPLWFYHLYTWIIFRSIETDNFRLTEWTRLFFSSTITFINLQKTEKMILVSVIALMQTFLMSEFMSLVNRASTDKALVALFTLSLLLCLFENPNADESKYIQNRNKLTRFYGQKDPTKIKNIDKLLMNYVGNEKLLFARLCKKYQSETKVDTNNVSTANANRKEVDTKDVDTKDEKNEKCISPKQTTRKITISKKISPKAKLNNRPRRNVNQLK